MSSVVGRILQETAGVRENMSFFGNLLVDSNRERLCIQRNAFYLELIINNFQKYWSAII